MARARMINRDVAGSERFWDLDYRARVAYCLGLAFTDRDGFLPGKPRKLLGLYLGMSGWTVEEVAAIRDSLAEAGLWRVHAHKSHGTVVEVRRFHDYQPGCRPGTTRYNSEAPSKYAVTSDRDETVTVPAQDCDETVKEPRPKVRERKEREEKRMDSPSRLLAAFNERSEALGEIADLPSYSTLQTLAAVDESGVLARWPTQDELVQEIDRTVQGMTRKSLPISWGTVAKHLGEEWTSGNGPHKWPPMTDPYPSEEETQAYLKDLRGEE